MFLAGGGDIGGQAGCLRVVAAHQALKLGELVDHFRRQVGLGDLRGQLGLVGFCIHLRGEGTGQRGDPFDPGLLAAQLVVEGHVLQPVGPGGQALVLRHAQVVLPEELRIRQAGGQHLLVARKDGGAVVRRLDVGDGDELLDPAGGGVLHGKELLVFLHGGLQHLRRQPEEGVGDVAHQHDWPFHEARDLRQKALVLDNFKALGKGHVGGIVPDVLGAFPGRKDHVRALQFRGVIVEGGDLERRAAHEAVALRGAAGADAVDFQVDHVFAALVAHHAEDAVQGAHPAQAARAPAHRLGPREAAHGLFELLGHDGLGLAARGGDGGVVEGALLVLALLELVAGDARAAHEAFERLVRRADLRAAALFLQGGAFGGQPLDRQAEAARRVEGRGGGIGQTGLDQTVGHHLLQVFGRPRLHARRDFLGKEFDQKVGHRLTTALARALAARASSLQRCLAGQAGGRKRRRCSLRPGRGQAVASLSLPSAFSLARRARVMTSLPS